MASASHNLDCKQKLKSMNTYTKFDLCAGFNNVQITSSHEWQTAFWTWYGSFKYLVMPFRLTNAPAIFQHFMNDIFQDMAHLFVIVYLDDILIFLKNKEDHQKHVWMVLEHQKYNLFIKPEKCQFHLDWVEFLGFIVSPAGVSMDVEKNSCNHQVAHANKPLQSPIIPGLC